MDSKDLLIISAGDVAEYSKCPHRAFRTWGIERPKVIEGPLIISKVIKALYTRASKVRKPAKWRMVPSLLGKYMGQALVESDYSGYKRTLETLHHWYHNHYSHTEGIVNVPTIVPVGIYHTFYNRSDVLEFTKEGVTLISIEQASSENSHTSHRSVWRDMRAQAEIWATEATLDTDLDSYTRLTILPGSVRKHSVKLERDVVDRSARSIHGILSGMVHKTFYPSVSTHCHSCSYKLLCTI